MLRGDSIEVIIPFATRLDTLSHAVHLSQLKIEHMLALDIYNELLKNCLLGTLAVQEVNDAPVACARR